MFIVYSPETQPTVAGIRIHIRNINSNHVSYVHRCLMMTKIIWSKHVEQVKFTLNKSYTNIIVFIGDIPTLLCRRSNISNRKKKSYCLSWIFGSDSCGYEEYLSWDVPLRSPLDCLHHQGRKESQARSERQAVRITCRRSFQIY